MTTLTAIQARASYRGAYEATAVPRRDLQTIMEAGLCAPSGCNKQTTSVIAVDDPALLQKLKDILNKRFCDTAPAMLFVLTQHIPADGDRSFQVQDYAAAIENMLLAAVALDYQSCWIEGYITKQNPSGESIAQKLSALLGVPDHYDLTCVLPLGRAADPVTRAKKRPFAERMSFNGFQAAPSPTD